MIGIRVICSSCGETAVASVSQNIQLRGVYWSISYTCSNCGASVESDDSSPTPQEIREAILRANGISVLKLCDDKQNKIKAAKSLNSLFQLSTPNALKTVAEILKSGGIKGTEKEIQWLAENFKKDEVHFLTEDSFNAENNLLDYNMLHEDKLLAFN
jgi:hypothetical protein